MRPLLLLGWGSHNEALAMPALVAPLSLGVRGLPAVAPSLHAAPLPAAVSALLPVGQMATGQLPALMALASTRLAVARQAEQLAPEMAPASAAT